MNAHLRDPFRGDTRPRRGAVLLVVALVLAVAAAAAGATLLLDGDAPGSDPRTTVVRPCEVPPEVLRRVHNGVHGRRSGDVLAVERLPNQFGDRHSTPWPYTQDVPLVLWGPGFIRPGGGDDRAATVADIAPTIAELLGFDGLPDPDGRVLRSALLPEAERNGVPRLVMTVVWDGGGDNVLRRWPESWPVLKDLKTKGADFPNATVGSSPSITPAVHATIGTGVFPRRHGLPDIKMRVRGRMVDAWEQTSPKFLKSPALADLYDRANGNGPLIGLLARDSWHLGMIGHGAFTEGADKDIAVLDDLGGIEFRTNEAYYSMPDYMLGTEGLERAVDVVDRRDGKADRSWLGNPLIPFASSVRYTPAFSIYQTDRIMQLLRNEGFGADEMPDLFFTNYKAPDLAGHEWNMVEPEVRDNIEEADRQLARLIEGLDDLVGEDNYVLILTADHGQTPYPEVRGGWSVNVREMTADIERRFNDASPHAPLVLSNRGYQLMLDAKQMQKAGVTAEQVAAFVRNYRLRDNVTDEEAAQDFADRMDERLYLSAFTPDELDAAVRCAERRSQRERARRALATRARNRGLPRT